MYPIAEQTDFWKRSVIENPDLWTLGQCARSIVCVDSGKSDLEGVGFVCDRCDWKRLEGSTYSTPILRYDVLDAVYGGTEDNNPRLHFAGSDITVPIKFNEELALPVIALQYDIVRLLVDSLPLGGSGNTFPEVRLRMASLPQKARQRLVENDSQWRGHKCHAGNLWRE